MQHVNILKHPVFFAIPIVLIFTLYMFFGKSSFATGDLFGAKTVLAKAEKKSVQKEVKTVEKKSEEKKPETIKTAENVKQDETVPYRLNYMKIGMRYKIPFNGRTYNLENFPYTITIDGIDLIAMIPSDKIPLKRRDQEMPSTAQYDG